MDSNWINAGGIIPSGWELVPLKDLLLNDKAISVGVMYPGEHLDGGIPLIKVGDVTNGEILKAPDSRISPVVDEEYKRTRLVGNELLITLVGNPGECVIVEPHMKGWNAARALAVLRFKNPEIRHWLKLIIQSKPSRHIIDSRLNTTVQKTLNLKDVKELPVLMPSEKIRDSLCCYYYTLEHKSTLNRQINQTLEQMAQALFKSWFVDFDPVVDNALDAGFFEQDIAFPDELLRRAEARRAVRERGDFKPLPDATRQLFPAAFEECAEPSLGLGGWVPQGWNAESLENVTSLIIDHRGKTPKKLGGDWSERGHPAISAKNIKNGRLVRHDTIRYVDSSLYTRWMKDPLLAGDILMTSEAPLGELLYLVKSHDYLLSQRLYGIRADKDFISGCYLYFWLQTNAARADIDGRATGTTVVGIRQSELKQIKVMVPQKNVLDEFSNLVSNCLEKIESNEKQCIELEKIRDELLPQLISGKLRLDNIEADLAKEGVA